MPAVACSGQSPGRRAVAGTDELRYPAVSIRLSPEFAEYPDSGKFGVLAELPAGADGKPRRLMFVGRESQSLDYWEGE